jgi:hypothetical protein
MLVASMFCDCFENRKEYTNLLRRQNIGVIKGGDVCCVETTELRKS